MRKLRIPELMIVSVWIIRPRRLVPRLEPDLQRVGRAGKAMEKGSEARRASREIFRLRTGTRERRTEKAGDVQECVKSSLRIGHITSYRCGRHVSLDESVLPTCIPRSRIRRIYRISGCGIWFIPIARGSAHLSILIHGEIYERWHRCVAHMT